MSQTEAIRRIVEALVGAGIPYMLTGSFASSFHGVPRASQDIDLVIAPGEGQLQLLIGLLPQNEYYANLDMALDAARRESQCNILDLVTGWRADLILRKSRPFSMAEFDRRTEADFQGLRVFVASPEDVILSKLEWAKGGPVPAPNRGRGWPAARPPFRTRPRLHRALGGGVGHRRGMEKGLRAGPRRRLTWATVAQNRPAW